MFFKNRLVALSLCGFLICIVLSACQREKSDRTPIPGQSAKKFDRKRAELEYRLIQAELRLAKSEKLYLLINLDRKELQLKLKGAVVWNHPLNIVETDSQELEEFKERFQGDEGHLIRPLSKKHLFSAQDKTPDSVLAIVGEVAKVDPELLQRDVPERFELLWGSDLILEVRTEIVGKPKSRLKSTLVEVGHALRRPFGEAHIIVKMQPDNALTLYRAAKAGLPTLLYPPIGK